jgi:hypothetical protein
LGLGAADEIQQDKNMLLHGGGNDMMLYGDEEMLLNEDANNMQELMANGDGQDND